MAYKADMESSYPRPLPHPTQLRMNEYSSRGTDSVRHSSRDDSQRPVTNTYHQKVPPLVIR
jgi:hypothetical protein